jgi:hypothetical protein
MDDGTRLSDPLDLLVSKQETGRDKDVAEAALAHASAEVRDLGRKFLRELAEEGDPFAAEILRKIQPLPDSETVRPWVKSRGSRVEGRKNPIMTISARTPQG